MEDKTIPLLLFSLGELPQKAPEKEFEIPKLEEEDEDDFDNLGYDDASFYY